MFKIAKLDNVEDEQVNIELVTQEQHINKVVPKHSTTTEVKNIDKPIYVPEVKRVEKHINKVVPQNITKTKEELKVEKEYKGEIKREVVHKEQILQNQRSENNPIICINLGQEISLQNSRKKR